jgi:hypothetical protein
MHRDMFIIIKTAVITRGRPVPASGEPNITLIHLNP